MVSSDKNSFTPDGKPYSNALYPRTMEQALVVAEVQLLRDEEKGKLRFTIEEYLTLSYDELALLRINRYKEEFKIFLATKDH